MDRIRTALLAALCVATATATAAPPRLTAPAFRAAFATGHTLTSPATARLFDMHFAGLCNAVDDMPFDRTCDHVPPERANDPSPWPDVFLALREKRIVAVIVPDVRWAPAKWRCSALPEFDGPQMCTPPDVPALTHNAWLRRWSAFLHAAG